MITKFFRYEESPATTAVALGLDIEDFPTEKVLSATGDEAAVVQLETSCAEIARGEFIEAIGDSAEVRALRQFLSSRLTKAGNLTVSRAFGDSSRFRECLRDAACGTSQDLWKEYARVRIELAVGDPLELVADLAKRVGLLERMCMWLFNDLLTSGSISAENREAYTTYVSEYIQVVQSGAVKDRVDLEDKPEIMARLMPRFGAIGAIMEKDYLSPLEQTAGGRGEE